MSSELEDKYRTDAYELVNTLRAAMVGHSKQCVDPEYCRVCLSGGWELLDRIESDEDYD